MWNLAQYGYQTTNSSSGGSPALIIFYIILVIIFVAGAWKMFEKAGQAGWKAIIPIYNVIIMLRIVGMSGWYVLLAIIPFVNIIFGIILANKLAKAFGRGIGTTILLLIEVGYIILGFGDAKYLGPDGKGNPASPVAAAEPPDPAAPAPQ